MHPSFTRALLCSALLVGVAMPCTAQARLAALEDEPDLTVSLPVALREISGLALHPSGLLLAHDDEVGVVYSIDPADPGEIVGRAELPRLERIGDYEGIAVLDATRIALVTSAGRIVVLDTRSGEGQAWDTGLGPTCEIEGLAVEPDSLDFLLLCKTVYEKKEEDDLLIFRTSSSDPAAIPRLHRMISGTSLRDADVHRPFAGSGLEVIGDELLIVSARHRTILRLSSDGTIAESVRLSRSDHPQAEGITTDLDGQLWIADEGGNGRGRLSRYRLETRDRTP